jgi:hypothetical protein
MSFVITCQECLQTNCSPVVGRDPESNEIISVAIYCNDCQEATEYMRLKPNQGKPNE